MNCGNTSTPSFLRYLTTCRFSAGRTAEVLFCFFLFGTTWYVSGLSQRIDFQVQPQLTERSYYSFLRSHFAYWNNADVAAFLVSQLCNRVEEKSEENAKI